MTAAGRLEAEPSPLPAPLPWSTVMAFGLGALRLAPAALWAMTPRELAAAVEGCGGGARSAPLGRGRLGELMAAFPDDARPHNSQRSNDHG